MLYIVSTPIGNIQDISYRALHILKKVNFIIVENIKHSNILLFYYNIKKRKIVLNKDNEREKSFYIIELIQKGNSCALISNAGTPIIQDPGFILVQLAHQYNIKVLSIPGPCALIACLSIAGIECNNFSFFGFLSKKKKIRENQIKSICYNNITSIFYETPHKIIDSLHTIEKYINNNRKIVIGRELTKKFESLYYGNIKKILKENIIPKGEFIIILEKYDNYINNNNEILNILNILKNNNLKNKTCVDIIHQLFPKKRKIIYQIIKNYDKIDNY